MAGANENGCPKEDAEAIWHMFEVAGGYLLTKVMQPLTLLPPMPEPTLKPITLQLFIP
ncbi:hypothetical protein NXW50_21560 [Bacteroides thetaiotaomicron]|nr:hypothetical protein [Bacteroides thetaiotaomicron]MCS2280654.1 hypothetical protein [Bacteroides thetaiotaomicron]